LVKSAAGFQRSGKGVSVRGLYRTGRQLGSVVGTIAPDPRTQPLLAAFQPSRLRGIWQAFLLSWWLWILSSLVAIVAVFALVADAIA
jgi:hypothetical protein